MTLVENDVENPRQRIVVDSVEFGQVFRFHRVLNAVTQAMQPPRLIVALFTVLALIAVGKMWDGLELNWKEPTISRQGLFVAPGLYSDADKNDALRPIAERYFESVKHAHDLNASDDDIPLPANLNPRKVYEGVTAGYRFERRDAAEDEFPQLAERDREHQRQLAIIKSWMPMGPFEATVDQAARSLMRVIDGVLALRPYEVFGALTDLFVRMPVALWRIDPWYIVVYGFLSLLIMAVGGGALCRMSACQFAGRERLRARDALQFSLGSWVKLVLAPLLPLALCGVLAVILVAMGIVFFKIPLLDVVGGVLYGVNLLIGFMIAFILLTLGFSFILLLPAVASENCGPADALQRAIAYLLGRPLHLLGYVIVGLFGLTIGYLVVVLVAAATLNITGAATGALTSHSALSLTGDVWINDLEPAFGDFHEEWHDRWAAGMIQFWQGLVILLIAAYVLSYVFSGSTIIYLLMRKAVDDQDPSEIWRPGLVPGTLAPVPAMAESANGGGVEPEEPGAGSGPPVRHLRKGSETLGDADKNEEPPEES